MTEVPFNNSAQMFFHEASAPEVKQALTEAEIARVRDALISEGQERRTCRWCFRPFDPASQRTKTIAERGYLRTNLRMADNGTELVCCDDCWPGAIGYRTLMGNQVVPCSDPNAIPNPLLRLSLEQGESSCA
jgi:hypothetical protein